ncbi:hypothetical protein [Chryseobacterium gregarium]|uniref:hypothetical protein n=1 Tax=Chryseobacterium gregarium TaxID=456299 RepID=UPI0003F6E5FC|nr:hypothetical protein [Chryseobacterium gregarium]
MKTKILLLLLLGWAGIAFGQEKKTGNLENLLDELVESDTTYINDTNSLVSAYTFTQMVKKDFSLLVTGSPENTQVGKYAALSVDKNEQSFSFSPINYIVYGNDASKPFRHVLAINANGKLNNDGFFDFSDRRKLQVGGSWTSLWYSKYFYSLPKKQKKFTKMYSLIRNKILNDVKDEDDLEKLVNNEKDAQDYENIYHQEVEKYEDAIYKNYWTTKVLAWTKLNIGYAEDKLKIVDSVNSQNSVMEPINKNVRGAYFSLSGNIFYGLKNGFSFYLNAQLAYLRKTSLSEIYSTVDWNKVQYGNGTDKTVYYDMEGQSVYIADLTKFEKKYKRDIAVQLLCFIPLGQQNLIGLDLAYQNKEFITPGTKTLTSNKNIYSIGIMFPLRDKEGKITINIEPFWKSTSFNNYDSGLDESFWGVKFGIPLNQIF